VKDSFVDRFVGIYTVWQGPKLVIIQVEKMVFWVGLIIVLVDEIENNAYIAEPLVYETQSSLIGLVLCRLEDFR
jgi:hypothetical protein